MISDYQIGKFSVSAVIGVKTCSSGVYDAFLADTTTNYSCSISTTDTDTIYSTYWKEDSKTILDSCAEPAPIAPAATTSTNSTTSALII